MKYDHSCCNRSRGWSPKSCPLQRLPQLHAGTHTHTHTHTHPHTRWNRGYTEGFENPEQELEEYKAFGKEIELKSCLRIYLYLM